MKKCFELLQETIKLIGASKRKLTIFVKLLQLFLYKNDLKNYYVIKTLNSLNHEQLLSENKEIENIIRAINSVNKGIHSNNLFNFNKKLKFVNLRNIRTPKSGQFSKNSA